MFTSISLQTFYVNETKLPPNFRVELMRNLRVIKTESYLDIENDLLNVMKFVNDLLCS